MRGVVAVHLEYLANMGVTASMSTRILNNEKLWGLIACHHKTAKTISFELCSIFELLSNVISTQISSLEKREKYDDCTRTQQTWSRLIEQVYESNDIAHGLLKGDTTILQLFGASGAAIARRGELAVQGILPDRNNIEEILLWLHTRQLTRVFHTDHFSDEFDHAAPYMDISSGLLAIPFNPEKEEYLLLFRPEVKKVIDWGGNPGGRIVFEKDGLNYHPRHSFKQWRQIVNGTALPWEEEKLDVAETMRSFLYEYSNK